MYEVKFGYISGFSLVFAAFQPCGEGRGIEQQSLTERRPTGYYFGSPLTDLVIGDEVLAYILESLTWESDPLYILTQDYLYWEGDRLYWEGEWLFSTDDIISELLTWVGDPIGAGEYDESTSFYLNDDGTSKLDTIIESFTRSNNIYEETVKPTTVVVIKNL